MTSREGINPLRPYYIPQSGLSPASNATKEVPAPSPSSAQVFGSSARDLIPDIDYSDYLDSSPSVSDWCREAINNSLIRYAQVLIAQPLDVAKTILQVYVVSDNTEEDRRSTPVPGSTYDSVWRPCPVNRERRTADKTIHRSQTHLMMRVPISLPPPLPHQARAHRDPERPGTASQTAVAIFVQTVHHQRPSMP